MMVRLEEKDDVANVRALVEQAFPTAAEADLINALRASGDAVLSIVAVDADDIVGHAMLSRMDAPFASLGLAPVSVAPARQRTGVGSEMIRTGLRLAREAGWIAVFVLGEPDLYRRFGFDVEAARHFQSPYAGPHLMVCPLDGALPTHFGRVDYASAFAALG